MSLTGTPQAPAWQDVASGTVNRQDFAFASLEGLDEGDYALRVQASDMGQIVAEQIIPFTVDSKPPVVHLTAPVAGSFVGAVGGPLAIAGTIEEAHLASWRLEAGRGADPTSWTALASGTSVPQALAATWSLQGVADGLWTLRLVAVDLAGQTSETRLAVTVGQHAADGDPQPAGRGRLRHRAAGHRGHGGGRQPRRVPLGGGRRHGQPVLGPRHRQHAGGGRASHRLADPAAGRPADPAPHRHPTAPATRRRRRCG